MSNNLPDVTEELLSRIEREVTGPWSDDYFADDILALVREVRRLRKMAAFLNFSHDSNCSIDATGKCDCGYFDFLFDRNRN